MVHWGFGFPFPMLHDGGVHTHAVLVEAGGPVHGLNAKLGEDPRIRTANTAKTNPVILTVILLLVCTTVGTPNCDHLEQLSRHALLDTPSLRD